jgi:hypothetical protein
MKVQESPEEAKDQRNTCVYHTKRLFLSKKRAFYKKLL